MSAAQRPRKALICDLLNHLRGRALKPPVAYPGYDTERNEAVDPSAALILKSRGITQKGWPCKFAYLRLPEIQEMATMITYDFALHFGYDGEAGDVPALNQFFDDMGGDIIEFTTFLCSNGVRGERLASENRLAVEVV
ncbi:hypothetical protein TI39_contig336g00014 [Zymoseptoria brevis]|uniref:Uncharacterized protein n=1 Tax=Zymoseptoria brevis TaxID=1047168 RepID=A0A0F4GTF6_9PEZI|nr:hypothetical protein TI39_contig336g00014 [Zymoseptoria brevis]